MNYIDLNLQKVDQSIETICYLDQAILENEITVILGSPGSGKTTILKKYFQKYKNVQILTIKEFLKLEDQVSKNTKVLLLDGLDEFRNIERDKAFVVTQLGNKINKYANIKISISCREMDWYGDDDKSKLEGKINKVVGLYKILPLNDVQKIAFAELFEIKNIEEFLSKFSEFGFLENPQMFKMVANLFSNDPNTIIKSKKELYLTFIKNAGEQNPENIRNNINSLDENEILKYAGYLAIYYIFSNVESFEDNILNEICNQEKNMYKGNLEKVLNTKLFQGKSFIHRTIAEFLGAYYFKEYKSDDLNRIKTLFVNKGKVPSILRGTFSWLCSLSENEELIKIDPYYQAIYGDNSLFNIEIKKKVVLEIKEYATQNPFFMDYRKHSGLENFSNKQLDTFLIKEFNESLKGEDHYKYFLINAIVSTPNLSENMLKFLKTIIFNNSIHDYIKVGIVSAFENEPDFLILLLNHIKNHEISDEKDLLKECFLSYLYPKFIKPNQVAEYLFLYHDKVIGNCFYLNSTPYEDKFELVSQIHQLSFNEGRIPKLLIPEGARVFIEDYFLETILKFEIEFNAKEIYEIINYFRKFYEKFESITFNSYRYKITDELKISDEKLSRLADQLFEIFIEEKLKLNEHFIASLFGYFFNFKQPKNKFKFLLNKMNIDLNTEMNKSLFFGALSFSSEEVITSEAITDIAKKFNLSNELVVYLSHRIIAVDNNKDKLVEAKTQSKIELNDKYFNNKTDLELQNNSNVMLNFSQNVFYDYFKDYEKELSDNLFDRLKNLLKNTIFQRRLFLDCLTIKSFAKNIPGGQSNIDILYYTSSALNNFLDIINIEDDDFLKYLYIISLSYSEKGGILKNDFHDNFELMKPDTIKSILCEYINFLFDFHFTKQQKMLMCYIESEKDIEKLKSFVKFIKLSEVSTCDLILNMFLNIFNFDIKLEDLNTLKNNQMNEANRDIINAIIAILQNKKELFSENSAIALYSVFNDRHDSFISLNKDLKVRIIDCMMNLFKTEESIFSKDGFYSNRDSCATFLRIEALELLDLECLEDLLRIQNNNCNIWFGRIAKRIAYLKQTLADKTYNLISIQEIKKFILLGEIISKEDFFECVFSRLIELKIEIENNRNNDKDSFYNKNMPKNENSCRDEIRKRLNDKYSKIFDLIREKLEANNRVDLNIRFKPLLNFEIQIECKKDKNPDLFIGIPHQLVGKYITSESPYGIYLIFNFGEISKNNLELETSLKSTIPPNEMNNVKIVCIDLTYKNHISKQILLNKRKAKRQKTIKLNSNFNTRKKKNIKT